MKSTINQRFSDIVNMFFNGNISKMSRAVGVSQPTLRGIIGERASIPSYGTLMGIVDCATINISADWLLTGRGEMLKTGSTGSITESDEVFELRERVKFLEKQNELLTNILSEKVGMSKPVENMKGKSA